MTFDEVLIEITTRIGSEYVSSHAARAKEIFFDRLYNTIWQESFSENELIGNALIKEDTVIIGTSGFVEIDGNSVDFAYSPFKILGLYVPPHSAIPTTYSFVKKSLEYMAKIKNNIYLAPVSGVIYYYFNNGNLYLYPVPTSTTTYSVIIKYIRSFDTTLFDGRDDIMSYLKESLLYRLIAESTEILYNEINR